MQISNIISCTTSRLDIIWSFYPITPISLVTFLLVTRPTNRVTEVQMLVKTSNGFSNRIYFLDLSIDRVGVIQHSTPICVVIFVKFRPRKDACVGLWSAEPQPYVRQSVHRNFLYSGLTISLRNAPYHNHCMVLLMLNMLLLAVHSFFLSIFKIKSHPFFASVFLHELEIILMQGS